MGDNETYEPLMTLIRSRRSVRRYTREPVSEGLLQRLLEAAQLAPSAGNLQARDFIIVRDLNMKHELAEAAYGQFFVSMAPAVLVGCANVARSRAAYGRRAELYAVQDVTIAASYIQLAAEATGVVTCWIGAFDEQRVARALELPPDVRPVLMLPVGYPDESPHARPRMNLDQFIHQERWSPSFP